MLNDRGHDAFDFFSEFYPNNKTQSYLAIKQILTRAYNSNDKELIKKIIAFYKKHRIRDDLYQLATLSLEE